MQGTYVIVTVHAAEVTTDPPFDKVALVNKLFVPRIEVCATVVPLLSVIVVPDKLIHDESKALPSDLTTE